MTIPERAGEVRRRIEAAARRAGRDPSSITLVAVSKTFSAAAVVEAAAAGISHFGENRAQELVAKMQAVAAPVEWHFVGSLQKNKVRAIVGHVRLIHSVDSMSLAAAVARRARSRAAAQDVLIEVNVSGEESKTGVAVSEAIELALQADALDGINVTGLMTIPPFPDEPEESRPFYKQLAALRDELSERLASATELSMGMTRDFEIAIAEGATIVRVGEAIFGPRDV